MNQADRTILVSSLIAFAAVAWSAYEPYTFLHGDGAFYANINKSIARDGGLDQGPYHPHSWLEDDLGWNQNLDQGWSNVSLGDDGRWLPKHSFVLPVFATPFYILLGLNGLLIFHILMLGLLMLASFRVASTWLTVGGAATATLLTVAQPVILQDVYSYNNDVFYSALLMLGAWAFIRNRPIVTGLLMGVAVWAKATNILFVIPFGVWLLARRNWNTTWRSLGAFLIPILLFLTSNWILFGSPLTTSYDRILVRQNGQLTTESIREKFDDNIIDGTKRVLLHENQGLIPKAPLMLLTLPGLLILARRKKGAAIAATYVFGLAAFVLLHSKYQYTYARFFLPFVGLGVVPLGAFLEWLSSDWMPKLRPEVLIAAASFGVVLLIIPFPPADYQLSDNIELAEVTSGKQRCDYFNNMRQKWECNGERSHMHYWGVAVGDECTFAGTPRTMLWLHPPIRGRQKEIVFNDLPKGRLRLSYGLSDTSRGSDVRFEVRINGTIQRIPNVTRKGVLVEHPIEHALKNEKNELTIRVLSPPSHWRHFCFDASVSD